MIDIIQISFAFLGTMAIIVVVNQFYIIPTLIMLVIFYKIRQMYLKISLDIKRLSATSELVIIKYQ
jgi:ATP-binding cassette, subfamily C (CFTR/MRP), member 4